MSSQFDSFVKETKAAFIIAVGDGVLDASEVIQIAIELSQKLQKLNNLSGSEKKAILLSALKKGLDAAGGIERFKGLDNVSPELKAVFEENILNGALRAVDVALLAASGKLDYKKAFTFIPSCLSSVKALIPKDQVHLKAALDFAGKLLNKDEATNVTVVEDNLVSQIDAAIPNSVPVVDVTEIVISDEKK